MALRAHTHTHTHTHTRARRRAHSTPTLSSTTIPSAPLAVQSLAHQPTLQTLISHSTPRQSRQSVRCTTTAAVPTITGPTHDHHSYPNSHWPTHLYHHSCPHSNAPSRRLSQQRPATTLPLQFSTPHSVTQPGFHNAFDRLYPHRLQQA
jgi:hypothetical protein